MANINFEFNTKKGVAFLEYILSLIAHPYNYMSLLKLAFFADRYHIRNFARPVSGDIYYAMKFGPVPSNLKDIIDVQDFFSENIIRKDRYFVQLNSNTEIDKTQFSKSDLEAIDFSVNNFAKIGMNQYSIANLTHAYPEWDKYKLQFENGNIIREEMDYRDFLLNAKPNHPEFAKLDFKDPYPPISESDRKDLISEIEEMNLLYGG